MNKHTLMFGIAAVALLSVALINPALAGEASGQAATAGGNAKGTLQGILTGNIGLLIGLGITVFGLWTWIIGQKTGAGITMIIGGVLLTLAPGLFNGARDVVGGALTQFAGDGGLTDVKSDTSFQ